MDKRKNTMMFKRHMSIKDYLYEHLYHLNEKMIINAIKFLIHDL